MWKEKAKSHVVWFLFLSLGEGGPERLLWGFAGQTTCILAANVERESQISRRLVFFLSLGEGGPERLLWGFAGQTTCILAANVESESQISRRLVFFEPGGGGS